MNEISTIVETAEALTEPVTMGVEAHAFQDYARAERDRLWHFAKSQSGA